MNNKIIRVKVLGKSGRFSGTGDCFTNVCCSCQLEPVFFRYTACGEYYTLVPEGTAGAFEATKFIDNHPEPMEWLLDAFHTDVALACNNVAVLDGGADYLVADTAQSFEPYAGADKLPYCITRTKAELMNNDSNQFQLDYMEYGVTTIASETATTMKLSVTTSVAPVPIGTDTVAQAVCS